MRRRVSCSLKAPYTGPQQTDTERVSKTETEAESHLQVFYVSSSLWGNSLQYQKMLTPLFWRILSNNGSHKMTLFPTHFVCREGETASPALAKVWKYESLKLSSQVFCLSNLYTNRNIRNFLKTQFCPLNNYFSSSVKKQLNSHCAGLYYNWAEE